MCKEHPSLVSCVSLDLGVVQVEENRFLSVRDGMERTVRMQQHRWVEETTLLEKTKQRARKIDLKYAAHLRHAKADLAKQYDQQMDRLGKDQRMARSRFFMGLYFHAANLVAELLCPCGLFPFTCSIPVGVRQSGLTCLWSQQHLGTVHGTAHGDQDRQCPKYLQAQETNTVRKNAAAAAQRRAEHQQRERLAASRAPEQRKPMDIQQRLKGLATGDLEEVM